MCANVSIMPASVCRLVLKPPKLRKLDPGTMVIKTYTIDTVKIVGSCKFYMVHQDTNRLHEVTFFVVRNDGSVLLSCTTALAFECIQPRTRLDYLPPRAGLITSSVKQHMKTRCQVIVYSSRKACTVSLQKNIVPKLVTSKEKIIHNYPVVFVGLEDF